MSIYERIDEAIAAREETGREARAVLLTDDAMAELRAQVHADFSERSDARARSRAFLDEISDRFPTVPRKTLPTDEPAEVAWGDTVFGLPIERHPWDANVVATR